MSNDFFHTHESIVHSGFHPAELSAFIVDFLRVNQHNHLASFLQDKGLFHKLYSILQRLYARLINYLKAEDFIGLGDIVHCFFEFLCVLMNQEHIIVISEIIFDLELFLNGMVYM